MVPGMVKPPTLEVPVRVRPEALIPFHQNELFRCEIGRTSIVRNGDTVTCVRARHCDVVVDGERMRGVQAFVVTERDGKRYLGVIVKTKREDAVADLERAGRAYRAPTVTVVVGHPDTGERILTITLEDCYILIHDGNYQAEESGEIIDPGYVWIDFISAL